MDQTHHIFVFGDFELDEALSELRRAGESVQLQPKPLALLLYLVRHRDRVVSKRELLDEVWPDVIVSETALTSALRDARRALGDVGPGERLVRTLRGRGFRFSAPVVELAAGESAPRTPGAGAQAVFVGRRETLEPLAGALEEVRQGRARIVLLGGEPGIGKTHTAERFADASRAGGVAIARGWCYEGEGAPPFWPWHHALRELLEQRGVQDATAALGPAARDLAQIVPELCPDDEGRSPASRVEPEDARFRLFQSVAAALAWAAEREPVLVILDDLHSADASSLRLLTFLARELTHERVMILGIFRDTRKLAETLTELGRRSLFRRLTLGGLAPEEVEELVRALTEARPSRELVDVLVAKTDGNPLFIREIVPLLARDDTGALQVPSELAPGLSDVIRGRLQRLSSGCNHALAVASVIGREFELETLARVTGHEPGELERELESAQGAGIVAETRTGCFRFAHALVHETVYAEQPAARRAQLHRSVGEELESASRSAPEPEIGQLARHFGLSAASGADKAVDYAVRAGQRAMLLLAFEDAEAHYTRALELKAMADELEQCDLLLALGEACSNAGRRSGAKRAFLEAVALARELGDGERLALAAYGFADRSTQFDVDAEAVELLEEALAALPAADTPLRVRLLVRLAGHAFAPGSTERAAELARQAMESAAKIGDPALRASVLVEHNWLQWGRAGPDERLAAATECLHFAEEAGDQTNAALARLYRVRAHVERGDLASADAEFHVLERGVVEHRLLTLEHQVVGYSAMKALLRGDFADGEALTHEALALARRSGHAPGDQVAALRIGLVRREQGRLAELLDPVRELAERNPITGPRCGVALILAETGHSEAAQAELDALLQASLPSLTEEPEWLVSAALLAEVSHRLGDARAAAPLYALLQPFSRWNVVNGVGQIYLGAVSHYLGLLSSSAQDWDAAVRHLSDALRVHEKLGALPWLARSRVAQARCFLARRKRGDRVRATSLVEEAGATAQKLGMAALSSEIEALQGQLGAFRS